MKPWPTRLLLLAGASSLLVAIPALSQEAPESLLPPGFGQPDEPVEAPPEPVQNETQPQPGTAEPATPAPRPRPGAGGAQTITNAAEEDLEQVPVRPPELFLVPEEARRSPDVVGVLGPGNWGLRPDAFAGGDGAFLASLMRRLDAPLPSRWTSILLRRALLTEVPSPPRIEAMNWVAERVGLLLRMGEADAARLLVQAVEREDYTPSMLQAAVQTALATSDPVALCPLIEPGRRLSDQPIWSMSEAMCAALTGENGRASAMLARARGSDRVGPVDFALAQKIVGASADVRRAVTIDWEEVDSINPWRFGLATAAGLTLPEGLMASASPQIHAWYARAPMVPFSERLAAADIAASLGVFSNRSLVDLYSMMLDGVDPTELEESVAVRLRRAYIDRRPAERVEAMRELWNDAEGQAQRHARSILTAVAASRVPPAEDFAGDAANLIASMLSAGLDRDAARWSALVQESGDDRAWALLALGSPQPQVEISAGRFESFHGNDESDRSVRSRLLLAGLAGLGRLNGDEASALAADLDLQLGRENSWTRALDAAVRGRQAGTVALLAGVGMQTGDWTGVPAENLYRIVRALREVGLEFEARMIAAEALSRT